MSYYIFSFKKNDIDIELKTSDFSFICKIADKWIKEIADSSGESDIDSGFNMQIQSTKLKEHLKPVEEPEKEETPEPSIEEPKIIEPEVVKETPQEEVKEETPEPPIEEPKIIEPKVVKETPQEEVKEETPEPSIEEPKIIEPEVVKEIQQKEDDSDDDYIELEEIDEVEDEDDESITVAVEIDSSDIEETPEPSIEEPKAIKKEKIDEQPLEEPKTIESKTDEPEDSQNSATSSQKKTNNKKTRVTSKSPRAKRLAAKPPRTLKSNITDADKDNKTDKETKETPKKKLQKPQNQEPENTHNKDKEKKDNVVDKFKKLVKSPFKKVDPDTKLTKSQKKLYKELIKEDKDIKKIAGGKLKNDKFHQILQKKFAEGVDKVKPDEKLENLIQKFAQENLQNTNSSNTPNQVNNQTQQALSPQQSVAPEQVKETLETKTFNKGIYTADNTESNSKEEYAEVLEEHQETKLGQQEEKETKQQLQFDTLPDLLSRIKPENPVEKLILIAFYLNEKENKEKFSIKDINTVSPTSIKSQIDHSVLHDAMSKNFIELVPDISGTAEYTEYKLTKEGAQLIQKK